MLRLLPIFFALVLAAPARAELRLVDEPLRLAAVTSFASVPVDLRALAVAANQQGSEEKKKPDTEPGMDFDLLGEPEKPPPPSADAKTMRLRSKMLGAHQAMGVGLLALQVATTTVGQLNYSDKFSGGPNTNRYKQPHAILAYTNLGVFVATGAIALLAPEPPGLKRSGFDRVTLHKVSMFTAAAGMAAQVVLGVYTAQREGFQNQDQLATAHLAIGYATLAAMLVGVSAIVF
jgi:cytochrome b561